MDLIKYRTTLLLIVSWTCIKHSLCYPNGPPHSVCKDGLPIHVGKDGVPHPPQIVPSPFQIIVNVTTYKPGDVISVEVSSNQREMFKGLFLQMRAVPNYEEEQVKDLPVGAFTRQIVNTKSMSCDVVLDSITHKDPYMKMAARLNWKSPLLMKNDVVVRATVLTNFSTFWTDVESPRIKLIKPDKLPAEELEKPWLEEIIKTEKAKDKATSRELVKSRFTKGYKGVMDPHGYIMVHYVLDVLPFHNSHFGVNNTFVGDTLITNSTSSVSEPVPDDTKTTTNTSNNATVSIELNKNITDKSGSESLQNVVNNNVSGNINSTTGTNIQTPMPDRGEGNPGPTNASTPSPALNNADEKTRAYQQLLREVLDGDQKALKELETRLKGGN